MERIARAFVILVTFGFLISLITALKVVLKDENDEERDK